MMESHLILRLESPLLSFGSESIDHLGRIRAFPAASMLTGLFANAMGWDRSDCDQHQALQSSLIFASRIDRESHNLVSIQDFQTAQLQKGMIGWTTNGEPDQRDGSPTTFDSPHLRYRDYYTDMCVTVALRLEPLIPGLLITDLGVALQRPKRPLFIGRKPCLPTSRIFAGYSDGETAIDALIPFPLSKWANLTGTMRVFWSETENKAGIIPQRSHMVTDQRDWSSRLHGGKRVIYEGVVQNNG